MFIIILNYYKLKYIISVYRSCLVCESLINIVNLIYFLFYNIYVKSCTLFIYSFSHFKILFYFATNLFFKVSHIVIPID